MRSYAVERDVEAWQCDTLRHPPTDSPGNVTPTDEETARDPSTLLSSLDKAELADWVKRSFEPHPIPYVKVMPTEWDPCQGVPLWNQRHSCSSRSFVDDILSSYRMSGENKQANSKDDKLTDLYRRSMEGIQCFKQLLLRLRSGSIRAKAQKTDMYVREIIFLGYKVSRQGLACSEKKTEAFAKISRPRNAKELLSLLGCLTYWRPGLPGASILQSSLYELSTLDIKT